MSTQFFFRQEKTTTSLLFFSSQNQRVIIKHFQSPLWKWSEALRNEVAWISRHVSCTQLALFQARRSSLPGSLDNLTTAILDSHVAESATCVHCKGIHRGCWFASLGNLFLSSSSIFLKLTAGAFSKDLIPRNEFSFQVFTTVDVFALGQLESRRWLQVAFLLYHRDVNI